MPLVPTTLILIWIYWIRGLLDFDLDLLDLWIIGFEVTLCVND